MPNSGKTRELLQQLCEEYAEKLVLRVSEIESSIELLASPDSSLDHLGHIYREIHKLSGSAGTFGYNKLTDQFRYLEGIIKKQLQEQSIPDAQLVSLMLEVLGQIRLLAEAGPDHKLQFSSLDDYPKPIAINKSRIQLVYVVDDDYSQGSEISVQLSHFGYQTELFPGATQAAKAVLQKKPDMLVLNMQLPEGDQAGARLAETVNKISTDPLPIIFISNLTDFETRLASVRAGGVAYIEKPVDITLLLDQLERINKSDQQEPYRVLVIDDDRELALRYALILKQAGMDVQNMDKPDTIFEVLESFSPELIIMDLYMEDTTGDEVARVIRQHNSYFSIPIVFLSSEANLDIQMRTLEQGDDFLQKPISDIHLISAVRTRIERGRVLGKLMYHDSLTGLLNHITLKLHLETELARCRRHGQTLCYVMLDIDGFKKVNDSMGHQIGDRVLKSMARLLKERLRKTDQLGRYGGDEFGIILPHTDVDTAFDLIEEMRVRFSKLQHLGKECEFSLTLSAGIAPSIDCEGLDKLISSADEALYEAKKAGRNQVCIHESAMKCGTS